jgi:hypothetical protein
MISYVLFALSALCFAAMLSPRKSSPPARQAYTYQAYTYYVDEARSQPLPTWKRKPAPPARVAERVG